MGKIIRENRGFAIPMALMVLVVFSVLGVTISGFVSKEVKTFRDTEYFLQGRYLAEAAVEDGLFQIKQSLNSSNISGYIWSSNPFPADLYPTSPTDWITVKDSTGKDFGQYRWRYVVPTGSYFKPGDLLVIPEAYDPTNRTYYRWVSGTGAGGNTLPTTLYNYPENISFNRILLGESIVFRPNHVGETVRRVVVGVNITFYPANTPDSQVLITVNKWVDYPWNIVDLGTLK